MAAFEGRPNQGHMAPDRVYMEADVNAWQARALSMDAISYARQNMPKMTGAGAKDLQPIYGEGFFGIRWTLPHIWFQEIGIQPFTMTRLAGKLIPMWIPDPTGVERQKNPKAKTKVSASGVTHVLIFRRAAKIGARITKRVQVPGSRSPLGDSFSVSVPASYPGAPGRISVREIRRPWTTPGKVGGAIAQRNVGVRWRHPGLTGRSFLHRGLVMAAHAQGLQMGPVHVSSQRTAR